MTTPAITPPGSGVLEWDGELRGDFAVLVSEGRKVLFHKALIAELAAAFARRGDGPRSPTDGKATARFPAEAKVTFRSDPA